MPTGGVLSTPWTHKVSGSRELTLRPHPGRTRARRHVRTRTPITATNPARDERKNTHQNSVSVPSEIDGTPRPSPAIPRPLRRRWRARLPLGGREAAGRRPPRRSRGRHLRGRSMHSSGIPCPKHRTLRRPWEGLPQNRDDIGMTLRTVPDCPSHGSTRGHRSAGESAYTAGSGHRRDRLLAPARKRAPPDPVRGAIGRCER